MSCKVINPGSENHRIMLQGFGDFIGADSIEYTDRGNGEKYLVSKNGRGWEINVSGNKYDGGYATFKNNDE